MLETANEILNASPFAYFVVLGLTVLSLLMIASASSFWLAASFAPLLAFGGFAGIYAFRRYSIVVMPELGTNTLVAALTGLVAVFVAIMVLIRIGYAVTAIRRPVRR